MDIKCEKRVYFKQNKNKELKNKLHLVTGEHYKKKELVEFNIQNQKENKRCRVEQRVSYFKYLVEWMAEAEQSGRLTRQRLLRATEDGELWET